MAGDGREQVRWECGWGPLDEMHAPDAALPCPRSMLWGFSLARVPSPGELEAALAASNIMCLASGEVENLLKYYFFAEQVGLMHPLPHPYPPPWT